MRIRPAVVFALACLSAAGRQPPSKEAALGERLAARFRQGTTPLDSPLVQDYVNRLGRRLAAHMPEAASPFTFTVIADDLCRPVHQPAALPGGFVFVPAPLLLAAQDEAELAGMLAHAMASVVQLGNRQITRFQIMSAAPIPPAFLVSCFAPPGPAIPPPYLAAERRAELAADRLAVHALAAAGFDPHALLRYLRRVLPDAARPALPLAKPIAALEDAIATLPATTYPPAAGLKPIQAEVRRLLPPAPPPKDDAPTLRPGG